MVLWKEEVRSYGGGEGDSAPGNSSRATTDRRKHLLRRTAVVSDAFPSRSTGRSRRFVRGRLPSLSFLINIHVG